MSKRKMVCYMLFSFFGGVLVTFVCIFALIKYTDYAKGTEIVLNYGDSFRNIPLLDWKQESVDLDNSSWEYTFVYYLDKGCSSCTDSLTTISHICDVYAEMNVTNMIIWEGKSGASHAEKNGIPIEYNYTMNDAYIGTATPTFYILDQDMNVIFRGETMDDMVKKISLLNISDEETINKTYVNSLGDAQDERPILVYFSMIGCPDCELVNPIVESSDIQEVFQVITFYRDRDNVPVEKMEQVDNGSLLAEIYGVDWYPSFLILQKSGEYELVGETDHQDIEEKLLNSIH